MPGPKSDPNGNGDRTGKTARDRQSGKHARRLSNRRANQIRNNGGKQFKG